jgi:hypothetical protein
VVKWEINIEAVFEKTQIMFPFNWLIELVVKWEINIEAVFEKIQIVFPFRDKENPKKFLENEAQRCFLKSP